MKFYFGLLISILFLISCDKDKDDGVNISKMATDTLLRSYQDDFEERLKPFWRKELANSKRASISKSLTDSTNEVLRIELKTQDRASGGYRSEIKVYPQDSIGYITNYGFKFMLPESFFVREQDSGRYIIHQWHDLPPPGFTWKTNKNRTWPPVYLYIEHTPEGEFNLKFGAGLKTGSLDELISVNYAHQLIANKWYNFSCEILWSLYSNEGYVLPHINNEKLYKVDQGKIYNRNMYNSLPNYFKFGLYRSGSQKHDREIFFDDFYLNSHRHIFSEIRSN